MSEADELKAEIDATLDLEERAVTHLLDSIVAIGQMRGQLALMGIDNVSRPELQDLVRKTEATEQVANGAASMLYLIRDGLQDWRERL